MQIVIDVFALINRYMYVLSDFLHFLHLILVPGSFRLKCLESIPLSVNNYVLSLLSVIKGFNLKIKVVKSCLQEPSHLHICFSVVFTEILTQLFEWSDVISKLVSWVLKYSFIINEACHPILMYIVHLLKLIYLLSESIHFLLCVRLNFLGKFIIIFDHQSELSIWI